MPRWIQNFLSSRTARCHVQITAGPSFGTTLGLSVQVLCRKAANWINWCRKRKMSFNFTKTEGTVFSFEQELPLFSFKIGEETIGFNPTPKILGITLDEKLTFMEHLQNTEKKASCAPKIIREVKGIGRIPPVNCYDYTAPWLGQ